MILVTSLSTGTTLANVRYKWIAGGIEGAARTDGLTQPDSDFPIFRVDSIPPTNAEEMIVFDTTNANNWNTVTPL